MSIKMTPKCPLMIRLFFFFFFFLTSNRDSGESRSVSKNKQTNKQTKNFTFLLSRICTTLVFELVRSHLNLSGGAKGKKFPDFPCFSPIFGKFFAVTLPLDPQWLRHWFECPRRKDQSDCRHTVSSCGAPKIGGARSTSIHFMQNITYF